MEDNIRRTGFTNIRAEVWDALEEDPSWEEQADIVIADLPCSGHHRQKPDIKYQVTKEDLEDLARNSRKRTFCLWSGTM